MTALDGALYDAATDCCNRCGQHRARGHEAGCPVAEAEEAIRNLPRWPPDPRNSDDFGRPHAERVAAKVDTPPVQTATAEKTSPTPPSVPPRRIRLTPASDIKPRPVYWTWERRIPAGAVTLIPGREGIGKSLTLVWLTASITRGTLPGLHEGTPRPVIYAATEDSWAHTVVPRLMAAGADLELVYRVDVQTDLNGDQPLTLPSDTSQLTESIREMGVAMLALDPLMSVLSSKIDMHRDRELRTALDPLTALADETGCAVVGLAHFNKGGGNDALNLITGSRAFSAVARAVISIARDPDDDEGSCVMSQSKNNLGRLDLPHLRYVVQEVAVETEEGPAYVGRLRFTGESERGVADIIGDSGEDREERKSAKEFLVEALANGPVLTRIIERNAREGYGISARTLARARKELGVKADQMATGKDNKNEWWLSL